MLNQLTTKKNIRTFSVSPENLTGEKGKGGMATEGSASRQARELGQGCKVNPVLVSQPGETTVPLFTQVEIVGSKVDQTHVGSTLSLTVNAYAVQSENNPAEFPWHANGWPADTGGADQ